MSFSSIWNNLTKNKPDLLDSKSKIVITSKEFKSLLEQVYNKGVKDGKVTEIPQKDKNLFDFGDLFSNIFKNK